MKSTRAVITLHCKFIRWVWPPLLHAHTSHVTCCSLSYSTHSMLFSSCVLTSNPMLRPGMRTRAVAGVPLPVHQLAGGEGGADGPGADAAGGQGASHLRLAPPHVRPSGIHPKPLTAARMAIFRPCITQLILAPITAWALPHLRRACKFCKHRGTLKYTCEAAGLHEQSLTWA